MKIFVAKLSSKTTSDDLKNLFERFGRVTNVKIIMDHETKRSKCYGFVDMPNDSEAYVAVVELNEMERAELFDVLNSVLESIGK